MAIFNSYVKLPEGTHWRDKTQVKPDNFCDLMNTFKTGATTNYRKLVTFHRPFLEFCGPIWMKLIDGKKMVKGGC